MALPSPRPQAGWQKAARREKREETREKREERREKREERSEKRETSTIKMRGSKGAKVRSQKGGMVQKRVGPSGRGGQSGERRAQREAVWNEQLHG